MRKIRKLYFFDKKKSEEMISFLNNIVSDNYVNHIMFHPLSPLHHLLPVALKFLPETFVLTEDSQLKGLITVAPTGSKFRRVEIQKLFFEENSFEIASEIIQYAVSKYKAMGAFSVLIKVDDYLPELLSVLVSKCGFSQISYEKLWKVTKFVDSEFDKRSYRSFRNSDAEAVVSIYNDGLFSHFRPLLGKGKEEFKESFLQGLSYYSEYKYVLEDSANNKVLACIVIKTYDNENYVVEIIQTPCIELDIKQVLSFATYQIRKRKKRFGLFVRTKRFMSFGEKLEAQMIENGFECIQNQIVLTNSSAKVLKEDVKNGKFTVLSDFCTSKPVPTQKICNKM